MATAKQILPPTPFSRRYIRWMVGFTVGVALGMSPFLGNVNIPGFRALLTAIPFQIQFELVTLSAFFMGIVAVALQFYAGERISRSFLRKLFGFALIAMGIGFFLFVSLLNLFTVPVPRGGKDINVLIGPSPTPECSQRCSNPEGAPVDCIKRLSLDPGKIQSCWGYAALQRRGLLLKISYLLLTGGLGALIGLALLQRAKIESDQRKPKRRRKRKPAAAAPEQETPPAAVPPQE